MGSYTSNRSGAGEGHIDTDRLMVLKQKFFPLGG
jgi:hypothetical protein